MGNCMSLPSTQVFDQLRTSKKIDSQLKEDGKKIHREIKMLLLGSGESGKTTILKQLGVIYERSGFGASQRGYYQRQIFMNLIGAINLCLEFMNREEIDLEDKTLLALVPLFSADAEIEFGMSYPDHYLEPLKRVWIDGGTRRAIFRGNEWAMPENMHFFYSNLDRLFDPSYSPTDQDILQCRGKTVGINEVIFNVGDFRYRVLDVGGQRSERKKWMQCFDDVASVVFVVAISGYDTALLEDNSANQMQEALMLFGGTVNLAVFRKTPIVLFLNKIDIFKKKVRHSSISDYFPDYVGDPGDIEAGQTYFKDRFARLGDSPSREMHTHFTCAVNTSTMTTLMSTVIGNIICQNLQAFW